MRSSRDRTGERGSIIVIYSAVAGLVVLGAAVAGSAFSEYRLAQRTFHQTTAFYLAEAGVDQALVQLRTNHNYAGVGYVAVTDAAGQPVGGYDITVDDVGHNQRRITAIGYYPDHQSQSAWYTQNTVVATATVPNPPFIDAVFANTSVQLTGNSLVDSYDSSKGPYPAAGQSNNNSQGGQTGQHEGQHEDHDSSTKSSQTAGSKGDVGTNATGSGAITITGHTTVKGNAWAGPGADPSTAILLTGEHATVSGSKLPLDAPRVLDPVTIPSALTANGDLTAKDVTSTTTTTTVNKKGKKTVVTKTTTTGQAVTLGSGTYYYHNVSIEGQSKIVCTGPVTLYVDGAVSIGGGGIATSSNLPPNLLIYVAGSGNVKFTGNGAFYGAVYAPQSTVKVSGNGETYGSLVGQTAQISGNGGVHYDESLNTIGNSATVRFNLWSQPS